MIDKEITFEKTPTQPHTPNVHLSIIVQYQHNDKKFVRPGTPYPKDRLGIQYSDSSLSIYPNICIDNFTERVVEVDKTVLPERNPVISTSMLL